MPQLEQIDSFVSQIFWLFAAFGIIYFFVSKNAAPRIDEVISKRQSIISSDIESATKFKEQAKAGFEALEQKLQKTKSEAQSVISSSNKEANDFYNNQILAAEEEIRKNTSSAESEILSTKTSTLEQLRKESAQFVEEILFKLAGLKVDRNTLERALTQVN